MSDLVVGSPCTSGYVLGRDWAYAAFVCGWLLRALEFMILSVATAMRTGLARVSWAPCGSDDGRRFRRASAYRVASRKFQELQMSTGVSIDGHLSDASCRALHQGCNIGVGRSVLADRATCACRP